MLEPLLALLFDIGKFVDNGKSVDINIGISTVRKVASYTHTLSGCIAMCLAIVSK